MGDRQEIQAIPGALRLTLEKAHAEYGAVARKIRWGDGPVYVCGAGECAALGVAAGYAFEYFLGLPVVARPVEVFQNYSRSLLHPRSVLVMISARGEWPEAQELARDALERGCTTVALANTPDSPLVKLADHVFLTPAEGDAESPTVIGLYARRPQFPGVRSHAGAARNPSRGGTWWKRILISCRKSSSGCSRSFRRWSARRRPRWRGFPALRIVGGGFYHYPAWQAARRMRFLAGPSGGGHRGLGVVAAELPTSPGVTTRSCFFPARNRK